MSYGRWRAGGQRARLEMVPLMDCMFLLLTFFIYVATQMVLQRGIPVDLAPAATGEPMPMKEQEEAVVTLDRTGRVAWNGQPVEEAALPGLVAAWAQAQPARPVRLQADRGVLHERVMGVLDGIRGAGVAQVILGVEPPASRAEEEP